LVIRDRVRKSIEFCLSRKKRETLEEVGREYRRRSLSGGSVSEDSNGKTLKNWIETDFSDLFVLIDDGAKRLCCTNRVASRLPLSPDGLILQAQ
jgi:hypothetical protein